MKPTDKPMRSGLEAMRRAPRCGARTRQGTPCQGPTVAGKRRCRMHGGAKGSGAPKGERHGHYKHGFFRREAEEARSLAADLIKAGWP